jgi:ATP-dependent exoDNAse (exonuclease V) beta subunit
LVIKENEIIIIDYKSDDIAYKDLQNPAPQDYQQQLNIYQNLLAKIYPNYKIGTAILWIKFLQLIKIN